MISEPAARDPEPISPELVLVSPPDVARQAREALPQPEPARQQPVLAPPPARPAPPPRATRRGLRAVLAVGALAALGAGAWYVATGRNDTVRRDFVVLSPPRTVPPPAPLTPRTTIEKRAAPRATTTTKAPAPPPAVKSQRKPKARPPAAGAKSSKAKARVGFVPSRTWAWALSPGARGYVFQLRLNGRNVLRARTRAPRFVLPRSFRFRAGSYRWTVGRIPASRDGRPLYSSFFKITAAVAALANR